jgi:serine/threonine-protein phosphatase 6 regulatory ankyrin repeat subunit B
MSVWDRLFGSGRPTKNVQAPPSEVAAVSENPQPLGPGGQTENRSVAAQAQSIHEVVKSGDLAQIGTLLDHSPNLVFQKNKDGHTALYVAAEVGNKDVAELLLAGGAQVDAKATTWWTSLHVATVNGHKDVVELLLRNGAEADARDREAHTPLWVAAREGHVNVASLLLASGAEVNAKDSTGGRTPLHEAARAGHKEAVVLLIASGAQIEAKDKLGMTALDLAGRSDRREVVALLREHGDAVPRLQRSTLDEGCLGMKEAWIGDLTEAADDGDLGKVRELLDKRKAVGASDEDLWGSLLLSAQNGHAQVAELFLTEGAPVNNKTDRGDSALLLASKSRSKKNGFMLNGLVGSSAAA